MTRHATIMILFTFCLCGSLLAAPRPAGALPFFEPATDPGDTRPTATNVDAFFSLPPPANVFGTPDLPTASITGAIGTTTDVDWYSFTGVAGATVYFDIDNAGIVGGLPDTTLSLFNSAGTLIAFDDDSQQDPGSDSGFESFLGTFVLPADATFFLAVASFPIVPTTVSGFVVCTSPGATDLTRPDGVSGGCALTGATIGDDTFFTQDAGSTGAYLLHMTNSAPVPEPSTMLLLGFGLAGLGFMRGRKLPRHPM